MRFPIQRSDLGKALADTTNEIAHAVKSGLRKAKIANEIHTFDVWRLAE
jgi:hypothetical protein